MDISPRNLQEYPQGHSASGKVRAVYNQSNMILSPAASSVFLLLVHPFTLPDLSATVKEEVGEEVQFSLYLLHLFLLWKFLTLNLTLGCHRERKQ